MLTVLSDIFALDQLLAPWIKFKTTDAAPCNSTLQKEVTVD